MASKLGFVRGGMGNRVQWSHELVVERETLSLHRRLLDHISLYRR
jgi:hypothetical protein